MLVHATTVAIDGRAILILGASGRGKSDLALRLIDRGAVLVADDYTEVEPHGGCLLARAPASIRGMIEVRGIGIVEAATVDAAPVALAIDLDREPERMPEAAWRDLHGIAIPEVAIAPFEASAAIKAELALKRSGLPLEHLPS
jgi:serine kinase of HPr protein (carbohydrate metabolism regulator)